MTISWDMTKKCTMNCKHCFNYSNTENPLEELADSKLINIAKQISLHNLNSLCFCGGEPLLRKELIFTLLKHVCKSTQVGIVTNGELIDQKLSLRLIKSEINYIQISLDGSEACSHDWLRGKEGAYFSAVKAIKYLENAKRELDKNTKIVVACCIHKKNYEEIGDLIDFCVKMNIDFLRFQPLLSYGRADENYNNMFLDYETYKKLVNYIKAMQKKLFINNQLVIELSDSFSHLNAMESEIDFLHIDEKGRLMFSPYVPFSFGNIIEHPFDEYINARFTKYWGYPLLIYMRRLILENRYGELYRRLSRSTYFNKGVIEVDILNIDCEQLINRIYNNII